MITIDEESELDKILGEKSLWKGLPLWYCELCQTFSVGCKSKCGGSSCNAGGCPDCLEAHNDFNKAKTTIYEYLNDEEQKIFEKIHFLKKYIGNSLEHNEYEINWKRLKQQGQLCQLSEKIFAAEIEKSFMEGDPDITYGEY